jgi:branched-chain amino acid transport system ATP-binding protein
VTGEIVLRTEALTRRFGALAALDGVSLSLEKGARHALIGPNGAGKTTLINVLTGALAPTSGDVFLDGQCITSLRPHERVKRGLARTYQITSLFPRLTVLESVLLAVHERNGDGASWRLAAGKKREALDDARALLATLRLESDADMVTARLAYGRQRILEIALALATRPRVLLLDEPAAGIPANESAELLHAIARLPEEMSVLFIEHDMEVVFRHAERVTVLAAGKILAEGTPDEIARDARVRAIYLGAEQP